MLSISEILAHPSVTYLFVNEPDHDYFCCVCTNLLMEPFLTDCGHYVCNTCRDQLLGTQKSECPLCCEPDMLKNAILDRYFQRQVTGTKVHCNNYKSEGCKWVGEIKYLQDHHEKDCIFACYFMCGEDVHRYETKDHENHHCLKRPTTCEYCGYHNTYDIVTKNHNQLCLRFPVYCPNNCTVKELERCQLQQHLSECPLQLVECPFSNSGCSVKLPRKEMAAHTLQQHNQVLEKIINQAVAITSPSDTSSSQYLYNLPPVVLTITDFNDKKEADEMWTSPPFYTHTRGYKFCLQVYPNGDGIGKCSHISVFACLQQGEYDNDLGWPFEGQFVIELLNNKKDTEHHSVVLTLDRYTDPESMCSSQLIGEETATRFGFSQFIHHSSLIYNSTINTEYLQNNCLRLRVSDMVVYSTALLHKIPPWQDPFTANHSLWEFTLTEFSIRRKLSKDYYSPPFYTHQHGYKLCLQVCPGGDGSSDGFHIPVFVCVMRGEHDELLQWPAKGEIFIDVINWREDKRHCKMAMSINANSVFFRVIENMYGKVQCCSSISYSSLPYNPTTNTEYLQEDCLRLRVTCNMVGTACPYSCGKYCHRDEMRMHMKQYCLKRLTTCEYCGYHNTLDIVTEKHYPVCLQFPIDCPNNCKVKEMERCQLQLHLNECPLQLLKCPCSNTGCSAQLPHKEMAAHTLQQHNQVLEEIINQAVAIAPLPGTMSSEYLYNLPPVVFIITDFLERKQADEVWTSPPYYTHTRGYKFCLNVHPNGDGCSKGTHISVFACLMRGEYNSELEWPFEGAISIQLCNWMEDKNHHLKTIHFNRYTDKNGVYMYTYRLTDKENATRCGFYNFIANTDIAHNSIINTKYLHNDCLHLRVSDVLVFSTALLHKTPSWQDPLAGTQSVCEFTLTEFSKRCQINHIYISPPFYTHPQGYKLCIQVYANGSNAEGTHVSVFATIMKGEHDQHLQWPFTGCIIFELLNWREDNGHHQMILSDNVHNGFDRAKNTYGMSNGFFDFILHSSLFYNPATNTEYLQEDCLRLRVMIGIACPFGCGYYFSYMKKLKEHQCKKWPTTCEYCGYYNTLDIVTEKHYQVCLRFPIDCPNNCKVKEMERCQLQLHLNECPLQLLKCPCSNTGCSAQLPRKEIAAHTLREHNQVLEEIINQAVAIAPLPGITSPKYLYNLPPVVFIITDFLGKKQSDEVWTSPPYYTHTKGYKFCLNVHPNGDGCSKGTHISVYACLMRGEYNSELEWPFEGAISIQLCNWMEDKNHHLKTIHFNRYTDKNGVYMYTYRLTDKENATRCGFYNFIANTDIAHNSIINTKYLHNDCLHLRVSDVLVFSTALLHKTPSWQDPLAGTQSVCEFTLTEFSKRCQINHIYISPPFYTHPQGYKLCIQVYANGSNAEGTHVSVFATIMKGEHDQHLQWPFTGCIIFELLNWREDNGHHQMILSDNVHNGFDRAKNTYGMSNGFFDFILHSSLFYNPATNTEYLQEDCLRLRVMIGIACPFGCGYYFSYMKKLKEHQCKKWPTTCEYCGYYNTLDIVTEKHYLVCLRFPIDCPNNCKVKELERCQLQQHLNRCPLQLVQCPCNTSCSVKLPRKEMTAHTLQQHNQVLEQIFNQVVDTASPPDTMSPEYLYNLPPVVFTITDFNDKKHADEMWTSPPFYTHTHGYKFCLQVYPNGDGIGKCSHISVFACLQQGEYDNNLGWPFEGHFVIELLNNKQDTEHHSVVLTFDRYTDPKSICSSRLIGEEKATRFGFSQFIHHSSLIYNSTINTEYLQNDCLRLRVSNMVVYSTAPLHKVPSWQNPFTANRSVCECTLTEFSKRRKFSKHYYSPPFYTHQQGYKLCLQVCPSGDGSSDGFHIPVFVCLMRGEHDELLQWPAKGEIFIDVINWREDKRHCKMAMSINANSVFFRVIENMYGKVQCCSSISCSSLPYNPTINTEYLQEDCLRLRVTCDMVGTACPFNCGKYCHRDEMERHKKHHCLKRLTTCEYCGYHNTFDIVTEKHYPVCLLFPIDCPNNCTVEEMKRCQLQQHLSVCPLQLVECPYSNTGCSVQLPHKEMAAHTLQQHNQVLQQIINQEVAITSPPATVSPEYLYNLPPVVFTITDFLKKKQADEVWTSPPYHTHPRGYTFCLKVYPNGDGNGIGTHISVYACVMRGGYDDELEWPFEGALSVQLHNWKGDKNRSKTFHFNRYTDIDGICTNIVTDKENATGCGFYNIIVNTDFPHNYTINSKYLHNNCLQLMVSDVLVFSTALLHKTPSWQNPLTTTQSVCEFTITEFSKRRQINHRYVSPPFYTHPQGYKLCLEVYANGNSGEGTHMSVFATIMKGEYDQHLQWPFSCSIIFELLNWREDNGHHQMIHVHNGFVRVKNTYGMSNGFYNFVLHSSLSYNPTTNTEYLQEDCLRLRVMVGITCPFGCGYFLSYSNKLNELKKHQCTKWPTTCKYCGYHNSLDIVTENHCPVCLQFPIDCPNNCTVKEMKRCQVQQHLNECPLQLVECPCSNTGCSVQLPRKVMAAHTLRQHNQVLEQIINQAVAIISPPGTTSPEYLYNLPPVVFTITDFLDRKQADEVWTSPPIHTDTRGYTFCLEVFLNGDRSGKGSHISVYACLMREEYDDELEGPFCDGDISVELCNWREDRKHYKRIIGLNKFSARDAEMIFDVSMMETSIRYGNPTYITHADLTHSIATNTQYVYENCLRLKVDVPVYSTALFHKIPSWQDHFTTTKSVCEFTLTDFSKRKQFNNQYVSPPFYTHPRGYKLCLLLYCNGYGSSEGSHVSMFIMIMRGKHDQHLQWPFTGDIILELLNWREDKTHHRMIFSICELHQATSRSYGSCCGFYPIITHSSLQYNPTTDTEYLQADCLRFRVYDIVINSIQKVPSWQDPFTASQSECEFTLTEFSKRKQFNNRYYSPPFYTHSYGYKLCLVVYANGYGSGEGSHVSVLATLMEGEHDQHLNWPFTGDLIIELLNWKMDQEHYRRTIRINAHHNFVRVIGKKYGINYGNSQFIAHSSLSFNQIANIEYLQDDCLRLRVLCNWINIPCSFNCGEYRIKPAMKLHKKHHCLKRPTTCEYCGYHNTYEIVTKSHFSACLQFPIDCPNNCMVNKVKRYQLQQHLNECPLQLVKCPCSNTGCSVKLSYKEMAEHTLQQHNQVLKQITKQVVAIAPPLATVSPQYLYNIPPVVFTITDYHEKKQANKVWTSPPFYTHTQGYKFCLELYANGNGSCKGTHVSVFVRLQQGEYDDDLEWPFEGDFWIELLDNVKNNKHHLKILHFNRYSDPFNRCTSQLTAKKMARSSGYSLFISHSSLSYCPTTNSEYLQDDCLRLRVSDVVVYSTALLHKIPSWQDPLMTNQSAQEFTLTEFSKRKQFNNKYISPPFYTHPQGYKLCLQVDSKDITNRMGSYVIIYICLMKGEHDHLLQWPFTGEITVTLLNWKKNDDHHKMKITIKLEHGFNQVNEGIYGKIYGYQCISLSSLSYNSISDTEYLQDDCLRFVVSVGIACTFGCGQYCCSKHEMKEHMRQYCLKRPTTCEHCGYHSTYDTVTEKHYPVCLMIPINCPNNCTEKSFERCQLHQHLNKCSLQLIECPCSNTGCSVQLTHKEMAAHTLKTHNQVLEQVINQVVAITPSPCTTSSEYIYNLPPVVFTITDFLEKKQADEVWTSPPFYTHTRGYKFCLTVSPNGDGSGKGTFVSVYTHLMRGEYDCDLQWPFEGDISVQICNWREDKNHHLRIINLNKNTDPDGSNTFRLMDKETAIGYGSPDFITHTDLTPNITTNTEYLYGNCLRLKVDVTMYSTALLHKTPSQ